MNAKQIAQQIKDSGLSMEQIQAEMERPVRIEELLRGGRCSIGTLKVAVGQSGDIQYREVGNEFPNVHSAHRAAKARLQRDRLEAYVAQENPDWDGVEYASVIYYTGKHWVVSWEEGSAFGSITMPFKLATELCNKLNNGEIEL